MIVSFQKDKIAIVRTEIVLPLAERLLLRDICENQLLILVQSLN